MATHSSVLAWRIPGTGEPSGLPSMGLHRDGPDWSDLAAAAAAAQVNNIAATFEIIIMCSVMSDCLLPIDCSPPGSSVHGISLARILEWVASSCSGGIFPTQRWNPRLLHLLNLQADSLPLVLPYYYMSLFINSALNSNFKWTFSACMWG